MGPHYVNEAERSWLGSIANTMLDERAVPSVRRFLAENGLPEDLLMGFRRRGLLAVRGDRCYLTRNGLRASGHECARREFDALAGLLALFRSRVLRGGARLWTADQICLETPSMTRPDVLRTLCFLHGLTPHHPPRDPDTGFVLSCYIDRSILDVDIPVVTGPHREYVPPSDPAALLARYRAGEHEFPAVRIIGHLLRLGSFRQATLTQLRVNSGELVRCDFIQSDLTGAFFGYVDLSESVFREAKLDRATFGAGRCSQTSFEGASLIDIVVNETDFRAAYVQGAQFSSRTANLDRILGAATWEEVVVDGLVRRSSQEPERVFVGYPPAERTVDEPVEQPRHDQPSTSRLELREVGPTHVEVYFDGEPIGNLRRLKGVRLVDGLLRYQRRRFHCLDLMSWIDGIQGLDEPVDWTEAVAKKVASDCGIDVAISRGHGSSWDRICACLRRIAALRSRYFAEIKAEASEEDPPDGWSAGTEIAALTRILRERHYKAAKDRSDDPIERAKPRLRNLYARVLDDLTEVSRSYAAHLDRSIEKGEFWSCAEPSRDGQDAAT